jgi:hypothetical protein
MRTLLRRSHECLDVSFENGGTYDQICNFLLLSHLPGHEVEDVRMIEIHDHELRGPPSRTSGFDRCGGPIENLEKTHDSR